MKIAFSLLSLLLLIPVDRDIKKSDLYGIYRHSVGEPGRVIKNEDGSETHIMPITYQSSTLTLKRWGRFEEQMKGMDVVEHPPFKGRWDLEGDSVILYLGERREAYFVQENGNLLHSNGAYLYFRERS